MLGFVTWRLQGGYTPSIARAVERLRQDFDQPLRIEQLAQNWA